MNKTWRDQVIIPAVKHLLIGVADVAVVFVSSAATKITNGEWSLPKRSHHAKPIKTKRTTVIDVNSYVVEDMEVTDHD